MFNLTEVDITLPARCPVLGIPLETGVGASIDASPTLDRVRPEWGYIRGNVLVISNRANRLKSDATLGELQAITEFYTKHLATDWMQDVGPCP